MLKSMEYKHCFCVLLIWLCCAHPVSCNPIDDSSMITDDLSKIKTALFRQLSDTGSMMFDLKTIIGLQSKHQTCSTNENRGGSTQTLAELKSQYDIIKESVDGLVETQAVSRWLIQHISRRMDDIARTAGMSEYEGGENEDIAETLAALTSQYQELKESVDGIAETQKRQYQGLTDMIMVRCVGQGGTVIQRRVDAAFHFPDRSWEDYKQGFGDRFGSFWLGLERMHHLTHRNQHTTVLRVELEDWEGEQRWAEYSQVRIDGESSGYRLHVSGYTGTAGDSLSYHSESKFSTKDRDNDRSSSHCATKYKGAWWYKACSESDLNRGYRDESDKDSRGIFWYSWKPNYSYKRAEMTIFIQN